MLVRFPFFHSPYVFSFSDMVLMVLSEN